MATDIKMPQLSDTMYSGKILAWKKNEGDSVARGDILAEVETDKANLEIESFHAGVLLQIKTPSGSVANVGDVIAIIGAAGESINTNIPSPSSSTFNSAPLESSPLEVQAQPAPQQQAPSSIPTPTLEVISGTSLSNQLKQGDRIKVSPLARKLAEQKNIELSSIRGSGPDGRIVRKDIDGASDLTTGQAALQNQSSQAQLTSQSQNPPQAAQTNYSTIPSGGRLTPLSKMRETIARRMQESVIQSPHFYTTTSVEMTQAKKLRELLKERSEYEGISINHLVIKAVAYAISREPRVNNTIRDNQLFEPGQINIGVITAVNDGLLIPVIKEADLLPLRDLVFEARAAIERARAGRPNSSDLSGGTFSISNMGMFDIENFTAIINPGQGAVLAVSSIKDQPVVQGNAIVIGAVMKATVSVDHRIIDGVMAGNFLKYFKEALETPALLMV